MRLGDVTRKRRFGRYEHDPRKKWYRYFRQARHSARTFELDRAMITEQARAQLHYEELASDEVKQVLEESYAWLHDEEQLKKRRYYVLCNDGSVIKCFADNSSTNGTRCEIEVPRARWLIHRLPVKTDLHYGIVNVTGIACSKSVAIALRDLTAFLLRGANHE